MKKERALAILYYVASVGFFLVAFSKFWGRENGVTWLALGSAMLCFGNVMTQRANKKDDDK